MTIKLTSLAVMLMASARPLQSAPRDTQVEEVVVTATAEKPKESLVSKRQKTSDTAALIADEPGVALQTGGGVSNLPVINGLADDRITITIDGMCLSSACANHMNPPLSYIPAAGVSRIIVKPGVTPVSFGGDNIGGTIIVETEAPLFAAPNQGVRAAGVLSGYYRSNNTALGSGFSTTVAGSSLSLGVTGSFDRANDSTDGRGNTITSTYYESQNVGLTLAAKGESSLLTLKAGHQRIPGEGFVNQWMDMTDNDASYANLGYKDNYDWGKLEAKAYWENTWHRMDSGDDKLPIALRPPVSMPYMPMETRGINIGYALKTDISVGDESTLRIGNEFHRFNLNDWWPPVSGTSMWPYTFVNINDGHRDRYVLFGEWESKISEKVKTILGVRNEQVRMDTGNVRGYSDAAMYSNIATAFNAQDHARSDSNWDLSALFTFEPVSTNTWEAGYARKTRSPNLYERYAWSTTWMTSGMINWFGDGNGYVGNLDLHPEVAHTVSLTGGWHDGGRSEWELKVTPFFTYVQDYIGVTKIGERLWTWTGGSELRNILKFTNHDAALYGVDVSGGSGLWSSEGFGKGQLYGSVAYVHGTNRSTGSSLYHMMPLNMKLTLEQKIANWTNAVEMQLVGKKTETDPLRFEPATESYALVNLRTAYQLNNLRIDFGVSNLFDSFYYLPLGGINYDNFLDSKKTSNFVALAGQGRSLTIGLTQTF